MHGYRKLFLAGLIPLLCFPAGMATAAPTGQDLLTACRQAAETGFDTMPGQMCAWYVTPCNCDSTLPQVCPPESATIEGLAGDVIPELTINTELQARHAALAAALILSEKYPCREAETD